MLYLYGAGHAGPQIHGFQEILAWNIQTGLQDNVQCATDTVIRLRLCVLMWKVCGCYQSFLFITLVGVLDNNSLSRV